jgi:hypothetical protein
MIYTPSEYSKTFLLNKKRVSARTVIRRANNGQLPHNHQARKLPISKNGAWVIEVKE